jgi:hypothetical protein
MIFKMSGITYPLTKCNIPEGQYLQKEIIQDLATLLPTSHNNYWNALTPKLFFYP